MRYKIKDIPSEGLLVQEELTRTLLADALEGLDANLDASTGNVRVDLNKDDDNVFARGDLRALVTVPCSSCLGPALVQIATPIKMTFVAEPDDDDDSADPLDDLEVTSHDRETIDLESVVRETLILSIPISPKCRENCLGLCATCGHNKNESDCGHKPPSLADPRLAVLKNLKLPD
ncbi:MAG: ribosomal protein L32p [Myxococcales bacterium]|nr:ribosomal protein L32p [Myxococcales bacterium]